MRAMVLSTIGLIAIAALWNAAPANAAVPADCQKAGGEVSRLIDNSAGSKNIVSARSVFQRGIMECMEGDDLSANQHYGEAKTLLTGEAPNPAPATATQPFAVQVDCQKFGGEVSSLIDTSAASKNIAPARSAFQRGIMECMEGDDEAANKHYREAKTLLTAAR